RAGPASPSRRRRSPSPCPSRPRSCAARRARRRRGARRPPSSPRARGARARSARGCGRGSSARTRARIHRGSWGGAPRIQCKLFAVDLFLERARALHAESLVLDFYADTFFAVHFRGVDIARRHRAPIGWMLWMLHCDLPRWKEGGLKAQGLGLVATKLMTRDPRPHAAQTLDLMHRTFE